MKIALPAHVVRLFDALHHAEFPPVYLVGGFVRNRLLGLPEGDLDLACSAPPQHLLKIASEEFQVSERSYGLGTMLIRQHFQGRCYEYEYTSFRYDLYGRGGNHTPESVVFTKDIQVDAQRRDFTVNALYAGEDGTVLDPTNRGMEDLARRTMVQLSPNTLEKDALRILRMVRFACELDFAIDPETFSRAQRFVFQLQDISPERLRDEFQKILLADVKYAHSGAVLHGLHLLKDLKAFSFLFPRLCDGDGVLQNKQYHAYDVLEHGLHSCACAPADLETRLAALLHDIGKPEALQTRGRMLGHDKIGKIIAGQELTALRFENIVVRHVTELIENHMFDLNNDAGKKAVIRMISRLGKEQFLKLCDLREADFKGSGKGNPALSAQKWRAILQDLIDHSAPLERSSLAVNGNDLMRELKIPPGKAVGELLQALHRYAMKKPAQNNYKSLIRYAKIIQAHTGKPGASVEPAQTAGECMEGNKRV
jgi:tRNA nucleotidyltransferase (CCA-adding enzyme)